ncbi:MAG: hypothetical protein ACRBEQ_07745 [Hyphomonas sp.]
MAFDSRVPDAYKEDGYEPQLLSAEELVSLDYAEPHPLQLFMSRWWRRTKVMAKVGVVVAAVGIYPVMTVTSHRIDDRNIDVANQQYWTSPEVGVAINKIARELEVAGWAGDRANWHPQTRLTAMPAWQQATTDALAEYVGLQADLASVEGIADTDLLAASRLMQAAPNEDMRPRLTSAAEALNRYDTRLQRGLAKKVKAIDTLKVQTALFAAWAITDQQDLNTQVFASDVEFPASKRDITTFYGAKARAHVALEMIRAVHVRENALSAHSEVGPALRDAEAAWERAAKMRPLIVSNQPGDSALFSNHLATMSLYVGAAEEAMMALEAALLALPAGALEPVAALDPAIASTAAP